MSNLLFIDSAYPFTKVIPGASGIAFYIGGDTVHVWSKAEVAAAPYRFRLPIWVRSNPPGPGAVVDATACLAQLAVTGAPKGCLVALDVETAIDAAYVQAFAAALKAAGYPLIVYASQSVAAAEGNPSGLYWGAQWTGAAHIAAGDAMTQYVSFSGYDESQATSALPFWDTQATAPLPVPGAGDPWPMAAGANGPGVKQLQDDLNRWKYAVPPLTADGSFGPATLAAVRHAQGALGMAVTGIVDEPLWSALEAAVASPGASPVRYPVPGKPTVAVSPSVVLAWEAGTPLPPHWRVQVAPDHAGKPGTVASHVTTIPHVALTLPAPGRYWFRVQAAGNSPFTSWAVFTA